MPPPDQKYKVLIDRLINHRIKNWDTNPLEIEVEPIVLTDNDRVMFFKTLLKGKSDLANELKRKFHRHEHEHEHETRFEYDPGLDEMESDDFEDIAEVFDDIEPNTDNEKAYELLRKAIIGLLYEEHAGRELLCEEVKEAIRKYPDRPDLVNALHRICEHRRVKTIHNTY